VKCVIYLHRKESTLRSSVLCSVPHNLDLSRFLRLLPELKAASIA